MKINNIALHKNRIQLLLYTWGIVYFGLLLLLSAKILVWLFMNIIHILEIYKFSLVENTSIFDANTSYIYLIALILTIFGWVKFFIAIRSALKRIRQTEFFISNHTQSYSKKFGAFILTSTNVFAFTAGFKTPKIYISSSLIDLLSKHELLAVLEHERHHQNSFDTKNSFFVKLLDEATIGFPFKNTLFKNHYNLRELCADVYAKDNINDERPLISALNKLLEFGTLKDLNVSTFDSKIERIPVLLGKSKLNIGVNYFALLALINLFTIAGIMTMYINPTADCSNFNECVSAVISTKTPVTTDGLSCLSK